MTLQNPVLFGFTTSEGAGRSVAIGWHQPTVGVLWRKRGAKWRLALSSGSRGEWMILQQCFLMKSGRISKCKMGTAGKILDRGMMPSRVFKG